MKTKQKIQDKTKILGIGITILLVVSSLVIWGIVSIKQGNSKIGFAPMIIAAIIFIFGIVFIKRQYSSVKKGEPYEDERSKKVLVLAGYYAFLVSLWYILILGWGSSNGWFQFEDVSQATGIGVIGMAVIFGISWLWVNLKGKVD